MKKIRQFVVNALLAVFFICTFFLVIVYFEMLWDKIARPQFKNINGQQVFFFGLLAIVFVILDVLIAKRFIRLIRGRKDNSGKV